MKKLKKIKKNRGMTYVELIVVLSIFSIMSSVVLFNYGAFQAKVDIKNLANDIALKIVEAQKSAVAGKLPPPTYQQALIDSGNLNWKPAYGVYFNSSISADTNNNNIPFNKELVYFTDFLPTNQYYDIGTGTCPNYSTNECLDKINITRGNFIPTTGLNIFYTNGTSTSVTDLSITFTRPNSGADIWTAVSSSPVKLSNLANFSYAQITILTPQGPTPTANIKVYASGRVQIN